MFKSEIILKEFKLIKNERLKNNQKKTAMQSIKLNSISLLQLNLVIKNDRISSNEFIRRDLLMSTNKNITSMIIMKRRIKGIKKTDMSNAVFAYPA